MATGLFLAELLSRAAPLIPAAAGTAAAAAPAATVPPATAPEGPSAGIAQYAEQGRIPEELVPVWRATLSREKQAMLDEIGEMRASGEIGEPAFRDLTADVFNPKVTENEAVLRIKLRQGYQKDLREFMASPGHPGGPPEDINQAFSETYGEGREELLRLREQAWKEHAGLEAKARESGEELSRYDAYYQETRPDKAPSYDPFGQAGSVPEKPPETEFMDAGDLVRLAEHRNDEAASRLRANEVRIRAINRRLDSLRKTRRGK